MRDNADTIDGILCVVRVYPDLIAFSSTLEYSTIVHLCLYFFSLIVFYLYGCIMTSLCPRLQFPSISPSSIDIALDTPSY